MKPSYENSSERQQFTSMLDRVFAEVHERFRAAHEHECNWLCCLTFDELKAQLETTTCEVCLRDREATLTKVAQMPKNPPDKS